MRHARGFTMVELIMVMIVMGVLGSVAIPRLTDRTAMQERGFREQLQALLRHARQTAVTQRRGVCVLQVAGPPRQAAVLYTTGAALVCNGAPVASPSAQDPYVADVPNGLAWGGAVQVRFDDQGRPFPAANYVLNIGAGVLRVSQETGLAY